MPRSRDVRVTRVLQRVACVRAVGWFLLSTWVQEKQRSGRAFAVHRWTGGLTAIPWFRRTLSIWMARLR